jgi:hypothetical protein
MTSRAKAKDTKADEAAEDTAAEMAKESEQGEDAPPCGAEHTLPLLAHVTCQRTAGHTDDPPQGADQGKHHARCDGASYTW